ncbi:hypothetical protein FHT79_005223 [Rhizobium sp. BK212]|nr:hypothetical protein [Rhizobium sp. BK212]
MEITRFVALPFEIQIGTTQRRLHQKLCKGSLARGLPLPFLGRTGLAASSFSRGKGLWAAGADPD